MASFGGDASGLQPGRSGADDDDSPAGLGTLHAVAAPEELATGGGIDHARDPVVARTPPPAHLVARDAWPHVLRPTCLRLRDEMRVGDLATDDGDHVRVPAGDHRLSVVRGADVALRLDERVRGHGLE